ncbi:MAG: hypothetical protein AAGA54_35525 [Myxococcota bacterium]
MLRLRWVALTGTVGLLLGACGDDAAPGGGSGANTTSGGGPTTFATFSTTAPPATSLTGNDTGTTDDSSGDSSSSTSDTDTDGADSSSTGASGLCPATHVCLDDPPKGWSGPVALQSAPFDAKTPEAEPPECGTQYPDADASGFEGLLAEPAACSCSCGNANGAACDTSTTLRFWGTDGGCSEGVPQAINIFAASCNQLPSELPGNGSYTVEPILAVGGACPPTTETVVEPAQWTSNVTACSGGTVIEDAGCAEGRSCTPLPESTDAPLCIWQEGEHECPPAFDEARMVFSDVEDGRSCETCSCSAPNGLCDDAVVSLWSGATCLLPGAGVLDANAECNDTGTANVARAASLNAGQATSFCTPSDPAPSGEAVGTDPVTVCCAG